MPNYLKQSTAVTIHVGPAVDATDGFTPETGLAAGTVDEIGVYKHEGTALTDISGTTTLTHRAGGIYTATLSTGDVGTLGHLIFYMRDDSVCRPVRHDFIVVTANIFDSLASTDVLNASVTQWNGTAVGTPDTAGYPVVTVKDGTGTGEIATTSGAIDTVTNVTNQPGNVTGTIDTVTNSHTPLVDEFDADDITEPTADHYINRFIRFTSGALDEQRQQIVDYSNVGGIGRFVTLPFTEAPANNDTFVIE